MWMLLLILIKIKTGRRGEEIEWKHDHFDVIFIALWPTTGPRVIWRARIPYSPFKAWNPSSYRHGLGSFHRAPKEVTHDFLPSDHAFLYQGASLLFSRDDEMTIFYPSLNRLSGHTVYNEEEGCQFNWKRQIRRLLYRFTEGSFRESWILVRTVSGSRRQVRGWRFGWQLEWPRQRING